MTKSSSKSVQWPTTDTLCCQDIIAQMVLPQTGLEDVMTVIKITKITWFCQLKLLTWKLLWTLIPFLATISTSCHTTIPSCKWEKSVYFHKTDVKKVTVICDVEIVVVYIKNLQIIRTSSLQKCTTPKLYPANWACKCSLEWTKTVHDKNNVRHLNGIFVFWHWSFPPSSNLQLSLEKITSNACPVGFFKTNSQNYMVFNHKNLTSWTW